MKINLGQFVMDTDDMAALPTGIATMPVIYVNVNGAAFLESQRPHWQQHKVRRLDRAEAMRIANTCNLASLKDYLAQYRRSMSVSSSDCSVV